MTTQTQPMLKRFFRSTLVDIARGFKREPEASGDPTKDPQFVRAHVQRLSRGNVLLQLGRFVTQEEIDERRRRVLAPR